MVEKAEVKPTAKYGARLHATLLRGPQLPALPQVCYSFFHVGQQHAHLRREPVLLDAPIWEAFVFVRRRRIPADTCLKR